MNKDGVIYVTSADNKLFALANALIDPELEITVDNIAEGENLTISISINNHASGIVSFTLNNIDYSFNASRGNIVEVIPDLGASNYSVNVTYSGDSVFDKASKVVSFTVMEKTVSLLDPELEVNIPNISEGETAVITIRINNQTTGNVTFTLDNVDYSFKTDDGIIVKEISDLSVGTYNVTVIYPGDSHFNKTSKTVTFNVRPKSVILLDPELEVSIANITEGEKAVITIRINNQTTGNVTFTLDNVDYSFKTGNGLIIKEIQDLKVGTYDVNVTYPGDLRFNESSKMVSFTVKANTVPLMDPELDVTVSSISQGEKAVITIKINNQTTGNVSFTLNNVDYSFKTGDGIIVKEISNLNAGTYTVNVTYPGDSRFMQSSKTASFTVKAVTSPSVSTSGSAVTIKLASDATGTLTVKINGKTYTKDLINGEASITLPDGTYNAVITYSGDSKYAGFTITKKVSVKKPVVKKASKIVAKKKTFKAKTKIKKYTVTLKSGKTPIKKVKLIIKIKKKTFKATTNSKGKATFKIKKLTKKGKYTATIKFQGNKNYKAATKKVKIVVK